MQLSRLLAGYEYKALAGDVDVDITTGVVTDSRRVVPGCLFVALVGRRQDGHQHVSDAILAGAAACLVSDAIDPALAAGACLVQVTDSLEAVSLVSSRYWGEPGRQMKVVSITGTNGKTSTASMLESVLRYLGAGPVGVIGTGGARIDGRPVPIITTTPTTPPAAELHEILRYMADTGVTTLVMEASSMALLQHRVDHVFTDVGVFTNLSPDHLDDHGTMDEYLNAKLLLFKGLSKTAVVNASDPIAERILDLMPNTTTYALGAFAEFTARNPQVSAAGTHFVLDHDQHTYAAYLPVPGEFAVANALAAIAVCHHLGLAITPTLEALRQLPQIPGRMETIHLPSGTTVIVDYAHSADSLQKVLRTLRSVVTGRLITVFGCGGDRDPSKRTPMGEIAGQLSDHVVLTSDNPRSEDPERIIDAVESGIRHTETPYERITDRREAISRALTLAGAHDTILLAGKGSEPYQLIGDEILPFDDAAVVRALAAVPT